jgi:hypothetical protein
MATVVPLQIQSGHWRRGSIRALVRDRTHAFTTELRRAYFMAFPPVDSAVGGWLVAQQCDLSRPSPPPAGAAALTEGALLYEVDGEPVSDSFIA